MDQRSSAAHTLCVMAAASVLFPAGGLNAQISLAPVVDRWMYPFASSAGNRSSVAAFGSGGDVRFDERDSEFYLAFPTANAAPSGFAPGMYRVAAASLRLQISEDRVFQYDPTQDPYTSYPLNGVAATVDADPGRPIELYGAAYRNGFNVFSFGDSSPFKPGSAFAPPWINVRNAYPIDLGGPGGSARDVSNNIRLGFESVPLAVGTADVEPGTPVPAGTVFTFALTVDDPGVLGYVRAGLAQGRLAFNVSSLPVPAEFGAGPIIYPVFYTSKAAAFGFTAALPPQLTVTATVCPGDYNADGSQNLDDLGDFITDFYTLPAIPGGLQAGAPTYSDQVIGFSTPCANAGDAPAPYALNAYRALGYRVGFSPDGSNSCPLDPSQAFPNLDNLADFLTFYYGSFGTPGC